MDKDLNLAVLIDGDNIPSAYVKEMMEEIAKYGNPSIRRIYGDWTKPNLSKWKNMLLENAITPIQQYAYTAGKNATDSAMIIDAMDILYSGKVEGFCLVSSDSDMRCTIPWIATHPHCFLPSFSDQILLSTNLRHPPSFSFCLSHPCPCGKSSSHTCSCKSLFADHLPQP